MIDLHQLIVHAVYPVKVRPREAYLPMCLRKVNAQDFEVTDTDNILAPSGEGTGVIHNPDSSTVMLCHFGKALMSGPWKINNLPSACDLIMHDERELIIAELTESNPRSIEGVTGGRNPGKMEKARVQLKATVSFIEKTGYEGIPQKRTAIFFFRIAAPSRGIVARSLNAFGLRPTLRRVTIYTEPEYPDWEFRNHPYPFPYAII